VSRSGTKKYHHPTPNHPRLAPTAHTSESVRMRLSKPKTVLLVCAALAAQLNLEASAATYVDAQNLIELSVNPIYSTATGYVAWQFGVVPLDAANEVSSIDAASGDNGFAGTAFRQVNPSGTSTVSHSAISIWMATLMGPIS